MHSANFSGNTATVQCNPWFWNHDNIVTAHRMFTAIASSLYCSAKIQLTCAYKRWNEHYNLKNQTSHKNQSVLKGWHSEDKISSFTLSRKVLVAESAGACLCITTNWLVAEPWLNEYGRKYMLIIIVFQIFEFINPASIVALLARPIISLTCCFYHNQVLWRCFDRKISLIPVHSWFSGAFYSLQQFHYH